MGPKVEDAKLKIVRKMQFKHVQKEENAVFIIIGNPVVYIYANIIVRAEITV